MTAKRTSILSLLFLLASLPAFAGTLVTHENRRFFYKDGIMTKYDGQYEVTFFYDIQKNVLIRTRVFDYQRQVVKPDNTVYHIQKSLESHPTNALKFAQNPVIRAIGKPDNNTIEVVSIAGDSVVTMTSIGDTVIVSHAEKLKVVGDTPADPAAEKKRRP